MYVLQRLVDEVLCGGELFLVFQTGDAGVLAVVHSHAGEDPCQVYGVGEVQGTVPPLTLQYLQVQGLTPTWGYADQETWRRWAYWEARLTRVGWATVPRYYSTDDDVGSWGFHYGPRPVRARMAAGERLREGGPWLVEESRRGPQRAEPLRVDDYVGAVSAAVGQWFQLREAWVLEDAAGRLGAAVAADG